jgi:hypothetical protein
VKNPINVSLVKLPEKTMLHIVTVLMVLYLMKTKFAETVTTDVKIVKITSNTVQFVLLTELTDHIVNAQKDSTTMDITQNVKDV